MPGGSVQQAKRRAPQNESAEDNSGVVTVGGNRVVLATTDPNRDQLLLELAKKRCLNLKQPEKIDAVVMPIINQRDTILMAAKALTNTPQIASDLEAAIPMTRPKVNGPQLANLMLDIHTALKAYFAETNRPSRHVLKVFEKLDSAVSIAISNFQSDHQTKQSGCFPNLSAKEASRKYQEEGFLPTDTVHRVCINCNHSYVDEPNSNKKLSENYEQLLRDYHKKKEQAQKDAKKNKTTARKLNPPKKIQPYRQCHCSQLRCVSVGSQIGSSCPIQCKRPDGTLFGVDSMGNCACPICVCTCSLAYTGEAAQALKTRQLLESNTIQRKEEMEAGKSRLCLSSLLQDSAQTALQAAIDSQKPFSTQTLQAMTMTAGAQALSSTFNQSGQHDAFVRMLRRDAGPPTTRVTLPAPYIGSTGKEINEVDTRQISGRKAGHRVTNNRLDSTLNNVTDSNERIPLQLYKNSYDSRIHVADTSTTAIFNGSLNEDDALQKAVKESMEHTSKEEYDLTQALNLSMVGHQPARGPNENNLIVLLSPSTVPATPKNTTRRPETTMRRRVEKLAFRRSLKTKEVVNIDNPTASPIHMPESPYAAVVFNALSDSQNHPSVANFVQYYEEEHPLASSQEVYNETNDFVRTLKGKPKKKRSKKNNN